MLSTSLSNKLPPILPLRTLTPKVAQSLLLSLRSKKKLTKKQKRRLKGANRRLKAQMLTQLTKVLKNSTLMTLAKSR
jgi:hypothetical protein